MINIIGIALFTLVIGGLAFYFIERSSQSPSSIEGQQQLSAKLETKSNKIKNGGEHTETTSTLAATAREDGIRNNPDEPSKKEQQQELSKVVTTEKQKQQGGSKGNSKNDEMGDSDLDDLLDDAFDELDMLDNVADDLLKETAMQTAVKAPASSSAAPKTWQDTLSVLPPQEKIEWAKTITRDIARQKTMPQQANYSTAYTQGSPSEGAENGINALVQGTAVMTPLDPEALLSTTLRKAMVVVNKKGDKIDYSPSPELLTLFKKQLAQDLKLRIAAVQDDVDNVQAEPERFKRCNALLSA